MTLSSGLTPGTRRAGRPLDGETVLLNRQGVRVGAGIAFLLAALVLGSATDASSRGGRAESSAQALRTCVDRWNQGNMIGWPSRSVQIGIRALTARERSVLSLPDHAQPRCTLSLANRPGENTWICRILNSGGYDCPLVTSDGMPPLKDANAKTDKRGVLTLDLPLSNTHATPPLAWQRFPHTDGFILPWTPSGTLRPGLNYYPGTEHGACGVEFEHVVPPSAGRCVVPAGTYWPCFPRRRKFVVHDLAACGSPGSTQFARFVVTARL